ncbi:MAG: hypothetical protein EAZ77_08625 [Nostocales cyanobacterium]|nr:MAG: hypothetical protein EAZ77_08625 [Nostocales cyanobacterium]
MTQTQITVLRRDYLEITGDYCAAKLIDYFKKWTHWKVKYHRTEWVYQPLRQIREDLMNEYSKPVITRAIEILENLELIQRRQNPGNRQDKTWQYKLNLDKLKQILCHRKSTTESPESKNCHSEFTVEQHHKFNTESSNLYFYPNGEKNKEIEISNQEEETFSEINQEVTQEESEPKQEIVQEPEITHEDKRSAPSPASSENCEVWEISPGHPYPVFLRWWAKTKYEPQGGHWANDAIGNAYSEFYKNRSRTTVAIFPQFLQYMETVTSNLNQQTSAEIKAMLPSCFISMPSATHENVHSLMERVEILVEAGAEVALPQLNPSPSCHQSMKFNQAIDESIKPLPKLNQPLIANQDPSDQDSRTVNEKARDYWRQILGR